jgi:hypothetical protein
MTYLGNFGRSTLLTLLGMTALAGCTKYARSPVRHKADVDGYTVLVTDKLVAETGELENRHIELELKPGGPTTRGVYLGTHDAPWNISANTRDGNMKTMINNIDDRWVLFTSNVTGGDRCYAGIVPEGVPRQAPPTMRDCTLDERLAVDRRITKGTLVALNTPPIYN